MSKPRDERDEIGRQIKAAERLLAAKQAKDSLITFTRLMMPSPSDPEDASQSRYVAALHHQKIAAALEEVERGNIQRLIIAVPPRHGKSQLSSKAFPAWFMGRDPYRQVIVASYSSTMAEDFGKEVRAYMQTPAFSQVFPDCKLKKGGEASDRLQTEDGGIAAFVGAGGALTGRGANLLIIDDPIKDRADADSTTMRDNLWEWFTSTAMTRLMSDKQSSMGRVVIIMTRWHEDDIVGRLTDRSNKHYSEQEAASWKMLHLPAIATEDNDVMGRKLGEPLWPERIGIEFLNSQKRLSAKNFASLYQGSPNPEDGEFFKKEYIIGYRPDELPKNLRRYISSDHAVSTKQTADKTCLLPGLLDEDDVLWISPDAWWRRGDSAQVVEAMLQLMKVHKPLTWWAERGHISQSIGPFLRQRMMEESVYCAIEEKTPVKDKMTRAQSIQGRMSMGKVRFPTFAPWWDEAEAELLKFPSGKNDDFVDALAWLGLGLSTMVAPSAIKPKREDMHPPGSMEWILRQTSMQMATAKRANTAGW
jgi:predicted phage terminase large subunit-like protein